MNLNKCTLWMPCRSSFLDPREGEELLLEGGGCSYSIQLKIPFLKVGLTPSTYLMPTECIPSFASQVSSPRHEGQDCWLLPAETSCLEVNVEYNIVTGLESILDTAPGLSRAFLCGAEISGTNLELPILFSLKNGQPWPVLPQDGLPGESSARSLTSRKWSSMFPERNLARGGGGWGYQASGWPSGQSPLRLIRAPQ